MALGGAGEKPVGGDAACDGAGEGGAPPIVTPTPAGACTITPAAVTPAPGKVALSRAWGTGATALPPLAAAAAAAAEAGSTGGGAAASGAAPL
jgi:hypothetical protein